jgi:hypothetical protein
MHNASPPGRSWLAWAQFHHHFAVSRLVRKERRRHSEMSDNWQQSHDSESSSDSSSDAEAGERWIIIESSHVAPTFLPDIRLQPSKTLHTIDTSHSVLPPISVKSLCISSCGLHRPRSPSLLRGSALPVDDHCLAYRLHCCFSWPLQRRSGRSYCSGRHAR